MKTATTTRKAPRWPFWNPNANVKVDQTPELARIARRNIRKALLGK